MYQGKDCVEKFVEYREEEVKQLHETFPRQPMVKLTDMLKRKHEAQRSVTFASKGSMTQRIKR